MSSVSIGTIQARIQLLAKGEVVKIIDRILTFGGAVANFGDQCRLHAPKISYRSQHK